MARIAELLSPDDVMEDVLGVIRSRLEARIGRDPRPALEAELADAQRRVERLAAAIEGAGELAPLVHRIQAAEERCRRVREQLETLSAAFALPRHDWRSIERLARRKLDDWRALLSRHTDQARPVLQQLLRAPLQVTPVSDEREKGFRFEGAVDAGEILAGVVSVPVVASPGDRTDTGKCEGIPTKRPKPGRNAGSPWQ